MTAHKQIAKLLKIKGFRCNGLAFRRGNRLDVNTNLSCAVFSEVRCPLLVLEAKRLGTR